MKSAAGVIIALLLGLSGRAQTNSDLAFGMTVKGKSTGTAIQKAGLANRSLIRKTLYLPYYLYKSAISSQDGNSCSFYPSCSNYAYESISELGLFEGLARGFDRLTRCHNLDWKHYPLHPSGRWYDPVH